MGTICGKGGTILDKQSFRAIAGAEAGMVSLRPNASAKLVI